MLIILFEGGKVKSFSKTPMRMKRESKKDTEAVIQYEFEENEAEHQIIIEPYEDYEEQDDEEEDITINKPKEVKESEDIQHQMNTTPQQQTLLSSNDLFLQSLKSTLDKLPDEKNMRARISIQEVLYKIMYEK